VMRDPVSRVLQFVLRFFAPFFDSLEDGVVSVG